MRFAKVYLEITNVCNRSCSFCPKTERKPEFITPERFRFYCEKLREYTEYLYFHLMGEPLLHPALSELLSIADSLGFRVILTTNGTLLQQTEQILLDAPALHKVNLSLHSFEANGAGELAEYLDAAVGFAKKGAANSVLVNFRLWNLDSAEQAGENHCNGEILQRLQTAFPGQWETRRGAFRLAERVYLSQEEVFFWPDRNSPLENERHGCYGLRDQLGVLCDGTVVPCCLDRNGELALGNLQTETIARILEKPRTQRILSGFQQGRAVEDLCKRCGYANRFQRQQRKGGMK